MAKPFTLTTDALKNDLEQAAKLLLTVESASGEAATGEDLANIAASPVALALLFKALTEGK